MANYASLKIDVDSWLARDDVAVTGVSIDSITYAAEAWLNRECFPNGIEQFYQQNATARSIAMQVSVLSSIVGGPNQDIQMKYLTPELIRQTQEWGSGGTENQYYTLEAIDAVGTLGFTFAPAPTVSVPLVISVHGRAALPSIVTNSTNNLLTSHYDIYLWALCAAGARWARQFALADAYDTRTLAAIASMNKFENRRRYNGVIKTAEGNRQVV